MITHDRLLELVSYDPDTGRFQWKFSRCGVRAGSVAGHKTQRGYVYITLDFINYTAHRLAWFYVYGEYPPKTINIDHINRDKSDNRISNLRLADGSQNQNNRGNMSTNTSGYRGVSWCRARGLYVASIRVRGETIQLGAFSDPALAGGAVDAARLHYFGEFSGILNTDIGRKVLDITRVEG